MKLVAREYVIEWPRRPLVMGIVNLSVDSFSGDGIADVDAAVDKAKTLIAEGADIIDIGAESARTNREPISEAEESAQLARFIERWPSIIQAIAPPSAPQIGPLTSGAAPSTDPSIPPSLPLSNSPSPSPPLLSINTWRPTVARESLARGGQILNDIGALPTDENARICAETGAALLIMHSIGQPKTAHTHVGYDDVMIRIEAFFIEKMALAERAGVRSDSLILDPGIDFAKQRADNLRIYRELHRLTQFNRPILLPVSRKTVIGDVLGIPDASHRDAGTVACIVQGMLRGAAIFRVHNVRAAAQTVRMIHALETAS